MSVAYRDARPGDGAELDHLFETSFRDTFGHLYRTEDLEAFLSSFGVVEWEAELRDAAYAVHLAEVDGNLAGYVKLGPLKLPVDPAGPALLLGQMYVLKAHHGSGIAQSLMDWAIGEARRRGAAELYLTVFTENHRARRFYRRYGFEEVGPYAFMVGDHADEDIIMRLTL